MGNCFRLFINNRLFAILKSESQAEQLVSVLIVQHYIPANSKIRIELAYIENIGF
jgi:hypothetical protein